MLNSRNLADSLTPGADHPPDYGSALQEARQALSIVELAVAFARPVGEVRAWVTAETWPFSKTGPWDVSQIKPWLKDREAKMDCEAIFKDWSVRFSQLYEALRNAETTATRLFADTPSRMPLQQRRRMRLVIEHLQNAMEASNAPGYR